MASTNPCEIIFVDDDDFDWEAAAREIDVACPMPNPSSSLPAEPSNYTEISKKKKKPGVSRQTTLDQFVGDNETHKPNISEHCEGDEGLSCTDTYIDAEAAKTWIYPVNVPLRDYQFAITKSALFSNTLVALPTGLGKTLIAAVVMYNYFRWFPKGKIVFAAPSRPLVMQQIEACHNIVGIPQAWTIDMTGQISPAKRADLWKTKRVFFVTPQVLEKDIHSGKCLVKYLVCLVIDEAHRAMGNYSYCEAVRELMAVPVQLRILALTATPGSKQQTIQHVIDNLHISALEYRNETDNDVLSYVHNRKIELIQVAMGQDAVEISSKFLEVIRPVVARLSAMGVLQNRDYRTLSPCQLLEIREKFRQAPPQDISEVSYGDVEGYFGVLITLYYIHKLLSSHGIRPAYEMLERKLKQGLFAKYMSKNEVLLKARLLMQQSLFHGAPSPKLSKMLEILLEHFKTNDPQNSRVIIFSNYRESVRDIMNALANIGEEVRATQFIGQSSGKTMKGQSQKVQQAVLEKFRSGAYNVIVATSIGEEGLDIMEVDLVISFDANVSPLRMIQRMGRTGRKHDGRVVVLACEGSELKGYLRKQAKSKAISKHMRNGGLNSFTFHPSPRMVPHVLKPEVQFVELSIEKFIPREKKVKDDSPATPAFKDKLTVSEIDSLTKYFPLTFGSTWRPSLIAFPHFQTFPSSVHKVKHSCRTTMLIDMMQCLQRQLSFSGHSRPMILQDDLHLGDSKPIDNHNTELGKPIKDNESHSRHTTESDAVSVDCLMLDTCGLQIQPEDSVDLTIQDNTVNAPRSSKTYRTENEALPSSIFYDISNHQEIICKDDDTIPETPIVGRSMSHEGDSFVETPDHAVIKTSLLMVDACNSDIRDSELSHRLTNFMNSGVVPESPIDENGLSEKKCGTRDQILPVKLHSEQVNSLSPVKNEVIIDCGTDKNNMSSSPVDNETQTPSLELKNCAITKGRVVLSQTVEQLQTLVADPAYHSFSEDSHISCEEMSESVKPGRKFKRLRKADNSGSNKNKKTMKDSFIPADNHVKSSSAANLSDDKQGQGKRKPVYDVKVFIEEEAEVSSEADVSDDEDDEDEKSFDSFIDDRMNPTATSQPGASRIDMMAMYRRSLLSQTPNGGRFDFHVGFSPDHVTPMTRISSGTRNSSAKTMSCFQTSQTETNQSTSRSSESVHINEEALEALPSSISLGGTTTDMRNLKRKLTFNLSEKFPNINLEPEFVLQSNKDSTDSTATRNEDVLCDDHLYDGIDLDELEAQATLLLKQKLDFSFQKQDQGPPSQSQDLSHFSSPSFDLGV